MLDRSLTKYSNHKRERYSNMLATNMAILRVELQGLEFLLSQEITMERFQASVIVFEMESLTRELRRLVSTTKERQ